MYLISWEEESLYYDKKNNLNKGILKNSWKGYSFDVMNKLTGKGYLFPVNGKIKCRKSVNLNVGFPTSFLMVQLSLR